MISGSKHLAHCPPATELGPDPRPPAPARQAAQLEAVVLQPGGCLAIRGFWAANKALNDRPDRRADTPGAQPGQQSQQDKPEGQQLVCRLLQSGRVGRGRSHVRAPSLGTCPTCSDTHHPRPQDSPYGQVVNTYTMRKLRHSSQVARYQTGPGSPWGWFLYLHVLWSCPAFLAQECPCYLTPSLVRVHLRFQLPFSCKSHCALQVLFLAAGAHPHGMFPPSAGWGWGGVLVLGNSLEHFATKLFGKFCVGS